VIGAGERVVLHLPKFGAPDMPSIEDFYAPMFSAASWTLATQVSTVT